jgi:hypothetical protein
MSLLIGLMAFVFFAIGWVVAIAAWFYAAYHFFKGWLKPEHPTGTPSHPQKALRGGILFVLCWLLTLANGLIGTWFGGWQTIVGISIR